MAARPESAILAGGCFWGMQNLIRKRPRIVSTMVGCTGGDTANATYGDHGKHAEAIEINFDAEQLSHRDLLEFFFQVHDPTTKDRQGYDIGADYRSAMHLEPGVLRPHRRLRTRGLGQRGVGRGAAHPKRSAAAPRAGLPRCRHTATRASSVRRGLAGSAGWSL